MSKPWQTVAALAVTVVVVAGCGGSPSAGSSVGTVTVRAYDVYPPDTISVPSTNPESPTCHVDARAFARSSLQFLAHSGPKAAYPADLYYVIMREELADFEARRCSPALLGSALDRSLTAKQRTALVAELPTEMAGTVRKALAAAGS
ncbi:MAG TPA: hypothetical protein VNH40_10015 [Gaiellaceae bacterium]|nr:hypothetical protein [Gaiellaceae bacterium]